MIRALAWLSGLLVLAPLAYAQNPKLNVGLKVEQMLAVGLETKDLDQARLTLLPEARLRWKRNWSVELGLRLEAASSDTGLGTLSTYDDNSQPIELGSDARLEIDTAVIRWRKRANRVTVGKQTLAWGVLDGLQVTDRFDAVRRREGIFTPNRPERISRWGMRLETKWAGIQWDAATVFDGTGDQLAKSGDVFSIRAPRLRAGLSTDAPLPDLDVSVSSKVTYGLRARRSLGAADVGLLVFQGPDTEPVITNEGGQITLDYPSRTLLGVTLQRGSGNRVWRFEAAFIPDQRVNLISPTPVTGQRKRLLAGFGLDWDLPDSVFINLQLGVDSISGKGAVRQDTDVITTLRLQKSFANDRLLASVEILSNLADGDGAYRPGVAWQVNDALRLETGLDLIWGEFDGLIGQFNGDDRVWLRATWAM
jgi:hypothetical protein